MIRINLHPDATRKAARTKASSFDLSSMFSGAATQIRDPFLIVAAIGLLIGGAATMYQFFALTGAQSELEERRAQAESDSTRYAAILAERALVSARRDSVVRQFSIIERIDGERFTWSHALAELSDALPPSTWLTRIEQTSNPISVVSTDTVTAPGARRIEEIADAAMASVPRLQFRVLGQTVDIQALTRYMRLLEASPFIENVNFVRSVGQPAGGVNLVEFTIEMQFEQPDSSVIRTVPLSVVVR